MTWPMFPVHTQFQTYQTHRQIMKIKTVIAMLAAATLSQLAVAGPAADALLEKLKKTYPHISFSEVNETPAPGVYEAVFGKDMLYVDATGTYFFPTMVNMVTKINLSEARRAELNKIDFSELPLKTAIKTVNGNGKRKIAVFADPNCGYCKKLEATLANVKDVTIYTYALGILGDDSTSKANAINSLSGDKGKIWQAIMVDGAKPVLTASKEGIETTAKHLALFKKHGFQGTPAIVFENGQTIKGYAEVGRIEEVLAKK